MPEKTSPTGAYLVALTPESAVALSTRKINLPHLPFRIGRESRNVKWTEGGLLAEKRMTGPPNNDLYLEETTDVLSVSREHLLIDRDDNGFFLLDRGSSCGTLVEGEPIGGNGRGGRTPIKDHTVFIIGTSASRFAFKFRIDD